MGNFFDRFRWLLLLALVAFGARTGESAPDCPKGVDKNPPDKEFHTTVVVKTDQATQKTIEAVVLKKEKGTIRLLIHDVSPAAGSRGFRVFVNGTGPQDVKLDDNPHYLGYYAFGKPPEKPEAESFADDLGPLLARMKKDDWNLDKLSVTLVPISETSGGPMALPLDVGKVEVNVKLKK